MAAPNLKAKVFTMTLSANDLARTLKFYTDGLGFELLDKFEQDGKMMGAMVGAGDAKLGISQDDFAKGRDRVKGLGMGIVIETDQDLPALAKRAKDAGIKLEKELGPLPWGPMAFIVKDPDGFKVTISSPS